MARRRSALRTWPRPPAGTPSAVINRLHAEIVKIVQSPDIATRFAALGAEPLTNTPLRRLEMAQDTGNAITGAVRADYFWGWGDEAEAQAGRMKQPLRMWVLLPRS